MQRAGAVHALLDQRAQVDPRKIGLAAAVPDPPGPQDLLDGLQQTIAVLQHDAVEVLALGFIDRTGLEGFQIQPDGRDRSLQFVGHGIDERILLLISPDLPYQKESVYHDAADQHRAQQDSQE